MHVNIPDHKLKRALEDDSECVKRFGKPMAKKIRLRMDALTAAESLADFWPPNSPPERCHELKGKLAGTFSMDVKQPYRLLFKSANSTKEADAKYEEGNDEKERWLAIREIEISGIEDTHE